MNAPTLYSGPAKVVQTFAGATFDYQAEGENGAVKLDFMEKRTKRSSGMHGYLRSTLDDQMAKITVTPFDSWKLLPAIYPGFLGIDTSAIAGGTAGALVIGTRPHDIAAGAANGNAPTKIWTPDGRLYNVIRTAITKHCGMKLGVGMPLFTGMEITGLADPTTNLGDTSTIIANNTITESGAADPDAGNWVPDFINGHWTAAWGTAQNYATLDAEDGWDVAVDAKYSFLMVQKRTYHAKLDSVEVIVKGRLTGVSHTQLVETVMAHKLGLTLGEAASANLVLTGPAGLAGGAAKTITVYDTEPFMEGTGFEFGGTKLGTGDVSFVTKIDFTAGLPNYVMKFSV